MNPMASADNEDVRICPRWTDSADVQVFERLKKSGGPDGDKEREEAVKARVEAQFERAQRRLAELVRPLHRLARELTIRSNQTRPSRCNSSPSACWVRQQQG